MFELEFHIPCFKCSEILPIKLNSPTVDCPHCGVNIVFENPDQFLEAIDPDSDVEAYQIADVKEQDTAGNVRETITVSFSRQDLINLIPN